MYLYIRYAQGALKGPLTCNAYIHVGMQNDPLPTVYVAQCMDMLFTNQQLLNIHTHNPMVYITTSFPNTVCSASTNANLKTGGESGSRQT